MSTSTPKLSTHPRVIVRQRTLNVTNKVTPDDGQQLQEPSVPRESLCCSTQEFELLSGDSGVQLYSYTYPTVGRSSTHTPRSRYSPVADELSDEDQAQRSLRTMKANHRRAVRRAADHAIDKECTVLVVGTLNAWDDPLEGIRESQQFGRSVSVLLRRQFDERCSYVGVMKFEGSVLQLYMLMSPHVTEDVVRQCWEGCDDLVVSEIEIADVEGQIHDMADSIRDRRLGHHRFIRSQGKRPEVLITPVSDIEEARELLRDQIAPQEPILVSARPFGRTPSANFRFRPIRS